MMVRNSLSAVDVGEVFEWIRSADKTGALELVNASFRKTIFFIEGSITGIDSNEPSDSLPYRFLAMDLLTPEQIDAAVELEGRTGKAFVDVLHATGAVMDAEMDEAIQSQALEALWSAFLWSDGQFAFREDELPEELPAAVSLEVDELLTEGRRRRELATRVRARLAQAGERFVWNPEATPAPTRTTVEHRLMKRLGRPWTVRDLVLEVPAGEFEVLQVVDALLDREAVISVSGVEAQAASSRSVAFSAAVVGGESEVASSAAAVGVLSDPNESIEEAPGEAARTDTASEPNRSSPPTDPALAALADARAAMDERHYEEAVTLFRRAERLAGGDSRVEMLRAAAEGVYCEILERDGLGADRRPVRAGDLSSVAEVTPIAHRLLVEIDGHATVGEIVQATGAERIDALGALRDLVDRGLVALEG